MYVPQSPLFPVVPNLPPGLVLPIHYLFGVVENSVSTGGSFLAGNKKIFPPFLRIYFGLG